MRIAQFASLIVAVLASNGLPGVADARTECQTTPNGRLCITEVDFQQFYVQAYQSQLQSQWCWAASISMVFAHAGYSVEQARIVTEAYGAPENIPALAGIVMAQSLNRNWQDDFGQEFSSRVTGLYDSDAGIYGITNQKIVQELDAGRPLVLGARTHAMVLTAVQYYDTPFGPQVVSAGVFDPWPSVGPRGLDMDEMTARELGGSMRFLASVDIRAINGTTSPPPEESGGGGSVGLFALAVLILFRAAILYLLPGRQCRRGFLRQSPVTSVECENGR